MLLTTLATASRKKTPEETENTYNEFPYKTKVSNTLNNMSKIVVMSGTATRGSIKKYEPKSILKTFEENEDDYQFEFIQKTSFEQLIRLQVPSHKSRYKKFKKAEKVTSKSCESIFECLKYYKNEAGIGDTQRFDTSQSGTSTLKTDVSFERKTKRKVQFTKICEENPIPLFLDGQEALPKFEFSKIMKNDDEADFSVLSECGEIQNLTNINKVDFKGSQKTISSEDFIENVVSGSEPLTLKVDFSEHEAK